MNKLSAMAAELAAELGKDVVVVTSADEHHDSDGVEVFYSIGVYLRSPWSSIAQFMTHGPLGKSDPIMSILTRAQVWLDAGRSLRSLGAPICTRCEDDGLVTPATVRVHRDHYCEACADSLGEAQDESLAEAV